MQRALALRIAQPVFAAWRKLFVFVQKECVDIRGVRRDIPTSGWHMQPDGCSVFDEMHKIVKEESGR